MSHLVGEEVGATVGYRVRLDSRVSARTRIEVVTEGVFTRMVLHDPTLQGVAGVLFDEFHERSLEADLGLAFARDSQRLVREDLRLLVMSATLDVARIARLLGGAPIIASQGRAHPVETRYLGRDERLPLEEVMARAIRWALEAQPGGLLAFLPGQGEILRTAERLGEGPLGADVDIHPLYGALDSAEQDRAIAPAAAGRRKVVLATAIAQTSLTLEGVRLVVDSGLARVPRFDARSGLTRLVTVRASRASVDQRRGRAGRTGPGVCWRLWDEAQTRSLPAFERPEILETDLTRLALDFAGWGAGDGADLALLDPPPAGALAQARRGLAEMGALDGEGRLTAHGRALGAIALPPRLAHMVVRAGEAGEAERAARIAAILTEPGLGGRAVDLRSRLEALERDRGERGQAAVRLAAAWARAAPAGRRGAQPMDEGQMLALAFPDRVARARAAGGEFQLANGRGAVLDPADPLARETWLAVAELAGSGARDRILLAAPLDIEALRRAAPERFVIEETLIASPTGARRARRVARLESLVVDSQEIAADPSLVRSALLYEARRGGLQALLGPASRGLMARVAFLRRSDAAWPDLSIEALSETLDVWFAPLLQGRERLGSIDDEALERALRGLIPWPLASRLDALAPARLATPAGGSHAIDYAAPGGPKVGVRVQELYGLTRHPTVGHGEPLTLALLSPAHREIQLTRDLPGFWAGSWAEVRKEMRGRYPRHPWPEDPTAAAPTTRAKPRS